MLQGKVYKFGDNELDIIAGRYLIYIELRQLAEHAFEMLGDGFPAKPRQSDILVAGRAGCGSAREQAVTAIQGLGIKTVVARSFARTFYRNAINSDCRLWNARSCTPRLLKAMKFESTLKLERSITKTRRIPSQSS